MSRAMQDASQGGAARLAVEYVHADDPARLLDGDDVLADRHRTGAARDEPAAGASQGGTRV